MLPATSVNFLLFLNCLHLNIWISGSQRDFTKLVEPMKLPSCNIIFCSEHVCLTLALNIIKRWRRIADMRKVEIFARSRTVKLKHSWQQNASHLATDPDTVCKCSHCQIKKLLLSTLIRKLITSWGWSCAKLKFSSV